MSINSELEGFSIGSTIYSFASGMNILYINYYYTEVDMVQDVVNKCCSNNFMQAQEESIINLAVIDVTNICHCWELMSSYIEVLGFNIMIHSMYGAVFLTKVQYLNKFSVYYQAPIMVTDYRPV